MGHFQKKSILVVDDDPQLRRMISVILQAADFDVRSAANGYEAIRMQHEHPADLVLTDLVMPEKEGVETISELRREYPDLRIIAMSGFAAGQFLQIARLVGAQEVLQKPFTSAELLDTMNRVL